MRERAPLWLSLAWREITANKAFTLTFILNLSLGLLGFLTLDAVKASIHGHLDARSQAMLGADLSVSAMRALEDPELQQLTGVLPPGSRIRRETTFLSMVAGPTGTARLVELKGVDADYPYYGELVLRNGGPLKPASPRAVVDERAAWVAPELLVQLGVDVGGDLKIGGATFKVADVIAHDPTVGSGFALAPKVIVGAKHLAETALITKGSRVFQAALAKVPPATDTDALAKSLKKALGKSDLRVRSHRGASEDLNRALIYLNDYLGLVALVALFLAGVGGAYLFRSFIARRARDVAILLSLGLPLQQARMVYVAHLAILGFVSTAITGVLAALLLPLTPLAFGGLMPEGMSPALVPASLATALGVGVGGSLLLCLPLLLRLADVQPATLFQEDGGGARFDVGFKQAAAWLPALLVYWGLAVVESHSLRMGSLFVAIFLGALAIFAGAGLLMLKLLGRPKETRGFVWEMVALALARRRAATLTSFVAIGLGSLLINLVPQLRALVRSELITPDGTPAASSLFLFDVQDEQTGTLQKLVATQGAQLSQLSPMIRARLVKLGDKDAGKSDRGPDEEPSTREDEEEQRAQNRGYNLSYRLKLAASEELVDGRPFDGPWDPAGKALPGLSLETRFAERLGLGLGDRMTFEIQGVRIEGVVQSTRHVRWTSFEPNFFVQFQPGALDDAPKTWVAAIPDLTPESKLALQAALVKELPNVAILDVTQTVERILGIVGQMALALSLMAALTLVAGFAVLFAIAHHQAQRRQPDMALLKTLGTDFPQLRAMAALEFGVLGLAAAGLGAGLSVGAAWVLSVTEFDRLWALEWRFPLALWLALAGACTVTGLLAVGRSLRSRPAQLLGAARFD